MGTATLITVPSAISFSVGAYSITDGDCDAIAGAGLASCLVGAYSITDGDCDKPPSEYQPSKPAFL